GASRSKVLDHELVVHHFVTHVDRRAEDLQGAVDDLDGAVDTGAEATGVGEFDVHGGSRRRARKASVGSGGEGCGAGRRCVGRAPGSRIRQTLFTSRISTSKVSALPASGWLKSMVTC